MTATANLFLKMPFFYISFIFLAKEQITTFCIFIFVISGTNEVMSDKC